MIHLFLEFRNVKEWGTSVQLDISFQIKGSILAMAFKQSSHFWFRTEWNRLHRSKGKISRQNQILAAIALHVCADRSGELALFSLMNRI